jgi:hypothetical protein
MISTEVKAMVNMQQLLTLIAASAERATGISGELVTLQDTRPNSVTGLLSTLLQELQQRSLDGVDGANLPDRLRNDLEIIYRCAEEIQELTRMLPWCLPGQVPKTLVASLQVEIASTKRLLSRLAILVTRAFGVREALFIVTPAFQGR